MAWSDCLLNPVSCVVDNTAGAAASSVWDSFLRWAAGGLTDLTNFVFKAFSSSTSPRFDQQWWKDNLGLLVAISLPILVGLFILQCVSAAIRREPGGLGRALVGVLIGTAGVPFAVAVIASCGKAVDEIALAILGNQATADGLKRMVDLSVVLSAGTLGGYVLVAVFLGLIATISLYVVMLLRDVAIIAFVVFAPLALGSWTWDATRHWLRRYLEVVGALVFCKAPMAVVFALGVSALGNGGSTGGTSIGTFLAGVLLLGMAALTPLATLKFVYWMGDHAQAAGQALEQSLAGAASGREKAAQVQQWRAEHFGSSGGGVMDPIVGGDSDEDSDGSTVVGWSEDDLGGDGSRGTTPQGSEGGDSDRHEKGGRVSGAPTQGEPLVAPSGLESSETAARPTTGRVGSGSGADVGGAPAPNRDDASVITNPIGDVTGKASEPSDDRAGSNHGEGR
ncbi:hypothetical protein [Kribbella ginsengisoli]|uniref:TrbL/VirB6 plasmid conjugal transfer protein n=1 Tax=Kribbella ginsengisoli TaxID=363865 RepID=A0ABP6VNZ1_9ACTN